MHHPHAAPEGANKTHDGKGQVAKLSHSFDQANRHGDLGKGEEAA
jgi:hypothetical protein